MTQPVHMPTGTFPDLDGTGGTGPLQIQATGEVFSSAILIKSADPAQGLMCKLIDAADWLNKNVNAVTTAAIATAAATAAATSAAVTTRINRITGGVTGASVTRISSGLSVPITPSDWSGFLAGSGDWTTVVNTTTDLVLPLSEACAPHGSTLIGVTVNITPISHASIAGLTLPVIKLYAIPLSGVAVQIGATTSDPSANAAAYSLNHPISISGLSHTVDRSANRYIVLFTSEHGGANAGIGWCTARRRRRTRSNIQSWAPVAPTNDAAGTSASIACGVTPLTIVSRLQPGPRNVE